MKVFECEKYGQPDVLKLKEVEKPVPKDNDVLIKVFATTVNGADTRIRGALFPSIFKYLVPLALGIKGPRQKILGVELSGEVESIGKNVTRFKVGDKVFASTGASMGAYAEYACLPEDGVIAIKPSNMTFEEAAAVPHCALAALHYIRKGKVKKGDKVLIYGASGGIGTFAVQMAKSIGAEVTGVCSTSHLDMVKSIGAEEVIDYTKESLAQSGVLYDVIFDTVGKSSVKECVKVLANKGIYLSAVHLELSKIFYGMWVSMISTKKVIGGVAKYTAENLNYLKELIESGKMKTVIDKQYDFEQMVEAHAYVDKGHKMGHVPVTVRTNNQ